MTYHALKEVGGVEAQMLTWQHTSYLSLNFVKNIFTALIVSYLEAVRNHCRSVQNFDILGVFEMSINI